MAALNITGPIIDSINYGTSTIMSQPGPTWIKILALIGMFSVGMTVMSQGGNVITGIFHVIGFFKWVYEEVIVRVRK